MRHTGGQNTLFAADGRLYEEDMDMSMKSWTEYGYGYKLFTGDNIGKIRDFLVGNVELLSVQSLTEEDIEDIRSAEDDEELEEKLEEYFDDPIPYVVAGIIQAKEGASCGIKGFRADSDTDQEAMLGIEPSYPWQTEYRSKEECDEVLKRYAELLGITEEPDFFDAEYYG